MPARTPAPKPGRSRDPNAPPKPKRPRDGLGRPLALEAENTLQLEDYDSLSLEENHRLGIRHFDAQRFFPAHEAWETCWKQAKGTGDAEFFKGLSQLGAGYVHLLRGNPHGAHTLLRRGAGRILSYPSPHHGVDAQALGGAALSHAGYIEEAEKSGQAIPSVEFPRI
jgi:predicted metal-dependent hydrolase